MSSANKKYSGYTGSRTNVNSTTMALPSESGDDKVDLFATSNPDIHAVLELYPTRDGKNVLLLTWNKVKFSGISIMKIYRIISTGEPSGYYSSFTETSAPGNIITGLGSYTYSNIVNNSDAGNGDLYREYINADSNSGKYITILFMFRYNSTVWVSYRYTYTTIENRCIASAPALSFDSSTGNLTIGTSKWGRRILEFYRADRACGYPTDISDTETLNEFQLTTLINMEGGGMSQYNAYYYQTLFQKINKWPQGSYTVGVQFNGTQNKTTISNAITNAITQINNVLNDYGVYFIRSGTSGDITITVDSEYNLFGIDLDTADYIYGGTWETAKDGDGYITSAEIKLANDYYEAVPFASYETIALEELAQAMGAGYDQIEYPYDTLHTDFNYLNKQSLLTTKDKNILKLLYSDCVSAGDTCVDVSKKLNLPKGAYCVSYDDTDRILSTFCRFMEMGASYNVRAWIVDYDGYMTYTSDLLNITMPTLGNVNSLRYRNRINGGATFLWDSVPLADGYEIRVVRKYDNYTMEFSTTNTQITFSTLNAGTTYSIRLRTYTTAYGSKQYGDWKGYTFTTNPSRPVLNLISTKNGAIEIDWTLEDTTSDYTYIWINIYETADATEPLVGTTIESGSGKSGHVTLIIPSEEWAISDGETFYLRAQVMYYDEYVSGQNLKCLTDSGAEYTLTLYIVVSSRPDKFEWDTPKVGKNFKITTGEVNRLHENINAVRQYMKDYVSGSTEYSFTYVTVGMTFSAGLYNAWVSAIKGISGFGTYINYVSAGDRITADLLNAVVNELNSVEKEGLS